MHTGKNNHSAPKPHLSVAHHSSQKGRSLPAVAPLGKATAIQLAAQQPSLPTLSGPFSIQQHNDTGKGKDPAPFTFIQKKVPDAPAPGAVIQRKVGFEFETALPIYADGKNIIAKEVELYVGANGKWHITPDAGNIEFVTAAFEEEGDKPETELLAETIGEMTSFVSTLDALNKTSGATTTSTEEKSGVDDDLLSRLMALSGPPKTAPEKTSPHHSDEEGEEDDDLLSRLAALNSPPKTAPEKKPSHHSDEKEKEKEKEDDDDDLMRRLAGLGVPRPASSQQALEHNFDDDLFDEMAALDFSDEEEKVENKTAPPSNKNTYLKAAGPGHAIPFQGNDVYVKKEDDILDKATASPQVTGGINLENVSSLIQQSLHKDVLNGTTAMEGSKHSNDAIFPTAMAFAEKYMQTIGKRDHIDTAKLKQLVTLIYVYLLSGAVQSGVHDQAKYAFPMMTRMSFLAIYNTLDTETQEAFLPDVILSIARLPGNVPVYKHGFLDAGDKEAQLQHFAEAEFEKNKLFLGFNKNVLGKTAGEILTKETSGMQSLAFNQYLVSNKNRLVVAYRKDNDHLNKAKIKPELGPERLNWLSLLQKQQDLMSSAPVTGGMYASSPAMGKYNKLDDDHLKQPDKLIQIELRRLQKGVPPMEWMPLALNLFRMFQEVQASTHK